MSLCLVTLTCPPLVWPFISADALWACLSLCWLYLNSAAAAACCETLDDILNMTRTVGNPNCYFSWENKEIGHLKMLTRCLICQNRIGFYDLHFNCGVEFRLRKTLSPFVKAGNLTLDLIIFIAFTVDTYFNSLFSTLLWLLLSSKLKPSFAALKLS